MKKGDLVSYNGSDYYTLVWLYDNGLCEIQSPVGKKVELVPISKISLKVTEE